MSSFVCLQEPFIISAILQVNFHRIVTMYAAHSLHSEGTEIGNNYYFKLTSL